MWPFFRSIVVGDSPMMRLLLRFILLLPFFSLIVIARLRTV